MNWWVWIVAGLLLLIVETLTPGTFVFVFFALGGLCAGALAGLGTTPQFWQQSAVMVVVSVSSLVLFRSRLLRFVAPRHLPQVGGMIGETAITLEPIAAAGFGKAECRGTTWTAHNPGQSDLALGQRCRIERVVGITLWLHSESVERK